MSGRTIYWMNVSMDLFIEHAPNEQGGGSWMRIGEELHREFNRRARQLALMVNGRVIYETMESFWPRAAVDDTLPAFLQEYGRIWVRISAIVISHLGHRDHARGREIGAERRRLSVLSCRSWS